MANTDKNRNTAYFKQLTATVIRDKPLPGHTASSTEVIAISINNCGTRLIASRTDRTVRIWKLSHDKAIDPIVIEDAHTKAVESMSWNPTTEHSFATVGRDEFIKIWNCSGKPEKVVKTSSTSLKLVRYSADGELLVAIDRERNLLVYAVTKGFELVCLIKIEEHVYDLQWFNYKHEFFIVALHDGSLRLYKVHDYSNESIDSNENRNGNENQRENGSSNGSSDGSSDVYVNGSGNSYSEDRFDIELRKTLTGHRSSATSVAISPTGREFAVGVSEGIISVWQTSSMMNEYVIADIDEVVASLDFSRDGGYIAVSFDKDSNSMIYSTDERTKLFEVPNSLSGNMTFSSICWYPTKTAFAYSSDHGTTITLMNKPDSSERKHSAPSRPSRRN